jgi:hypothetical protein
MIRTIQLILLLLEQNIGGINTWNILDIVPHILAITPPSVLPSYVAVLPHLMDPVQQ